MNKQQTKQAIYELLEAKDALIIDINNIVGDKIAKFESDYGVDLSSVNVYNKTEREKALVHGKLEVISVTPKFQTNIELNL